MALKGNQGNLHEQVTDSFRFLPVQDFDEQLDAGHGRVETRRCSVISDLSLIASKEEWTGLKSLIIKNDKSTKVGVRGKRLKAGWDNRYLIKIIRN